MRQNEMISLEDQNKELLDISNALKKKVTAHAIGGNAMMFLGLKLATLDIDLVFTSKEDREEFKRAAKILGYREMDAKTVYRKESAPEMIRKGDARIDLFLNEIINVRFTEQMRQRCTDAIQYGENLVISIADHHDIIIMKCATDRQKDADDVKNIIDSMEIDWETVINEAKNQVEHGRNVMVMELGYFLEDLKMNRGANIPDKALDALYDLLKKQIEAKAAK
jgi:hypothetical protein